MRATRHESDLFGELKVKIYDIFFTFLNSLVFGGFKILALKSSYQKDFFNEIGMNSLISTWIVYLVQIMKKLRVNLALEGWGTIMTFLYVYS